MGHGRDKRDPPTQPSRKTNGRDALVASAYGTWNTGGIPFSATRRGRSMGHGRDKRDPPARRCRSMGHGRDKRDPPARPSRRRQREGRACRVRLRNVEHRGHSIQRHAQRAFDGARSRQARPSRATIPEETTGGTRLSRPPTERGTQGTSHSAPRAEGGAGTSRAGAVRWGTVATSATLPRAGAVRWGTVATSATLPRDHPGRDKREGRACRVRLRNVASARATRLGNLTRPA